MGQYVRAKSVGQYGGQLKKPGTDTEFFEIGDEEELASWMEEAERPKARKAKPDVNAKDIAALKRKAGDQEKGIAELRELVGGLTDAVEKLTALVTAEAGTGGAPADAKADPKKTATEAASGKPAA